MRARSAALLLCLLLGSAAAWAARSHVHTPAAGLGHAPAYLSMIIAPADGRPSAITDAARVTITHALASIEDGTVAVSQGLSPTDRRVAKLVSLVAALSVFSSSVLGLVALGRRRAH